MPSISITHPESVDQQGVMQMESICSAPPPTANRNSTEFSLSRHALGFGMEPLPNSSSHSLEHGLLEQGLPLSPHGWSTNLHAYKHLEMSRALR